MKQKWFWCCVLIFILLSGCAAPAVSPTATLTPKPTASQTLSPTVTPEPTETLTPQPTITETSTPRPTPIFQKGCGNVTLGKPGTQSQDKTHPVLTQGTAILCNDTFRSGPDQTGQFTSLPVTEARLDLDTGKIGTEVADIWFDISGGSMIFYALFPTDNAFFANWGISDDTPEPTFDECKSLSHRFSNDNEPQYVCVITNLGHVSRIKVEQYNPLNAGSLKISFITWDVVAPTPTPYGRK